FEWNNSPIVYKTTPEWNHVRTLINNYFSSKAGLYHYLNTASGNYREYLKGETVKLKKYFYVVRPILACKWILDKQSPPPMLFSDLVEAELESEIQPVIAKLLKLKTETPEISEGPRINILNRYIEEQMAEIKSKIDQIPTIPDPGWESLDSLFLTLLN
ncbi:MAG: putative nucleotidyltransferase, partial [Clostridia bacterium]|nr:putative nucleotidyltransferase [Clostridia bacterium]